MSTSPPRSDGPNDPGGMLRQAGQALTIGMELAAPTVIGWWLDTQFGSAPVGVLVGGAVGFLVVVVHALRLTPKDRPPEPPEK